MLIQSLLLMLKILPGVPTKNNSLELLFIFLHIPFDRNNIFKLEFCYFLTKCMFATPSPQGIYTTEFSKGDFIFIQKKI